MVATVFLSIGYAMSANKPFFASHAGNTTGTLSSIADDSYHDGECCSWPG